MVNLTRLQKRGPGGNLRRANIQAPGAKTLQAIGNLGAGLANLSNNLLKERQDQQTREFRDNNNFDYIRDVQKFRLENQGLAKTDQAAYLDQFNTFLEDRQSEIAESAPTDDARNQFMQKSSSVKQQALLRADGELAQNARNQNFAIKSNQINESTNLIRSNPDPELMDQLVGDIVLGLEEDKTIGADDTMKLQSSAISSLRTAYFEGAISQDNPLAIQEARDLLESDNLGMTTASAGERARLASRLDAAQNNINSRIRADVVNQVKSVVRGSNTGAVNENDYASTIRKIDASASVLKPGEADKLKTGVVEARLTEAVSTTMGLTAPDKRQDIAQVVDSELSFVDDSLSGKVDKAIITKKLQGKMAEADNMAYTEPGKYFTERDPRLKELSVQATSGDANSYQQYKTKMQGYYEEWGHPRQARSFISPAMSDTWGKGIKAAYQRGDVDSMNALFQLVEDTTGEDTHAAFMDMRKHIPEDFAVMSEINDFDQRRSAIENMVNGKEIKELAKYETEEKQSVLVQDIMEDPFFEAVALQGAQENQGKFNALAMAKGVSLEAMKQMTVGIDKDSAIENAKQMYKNSYNLVESDYSDKVYPPKAIEGVEISPDKVKGFMESIREEMFNPTSHFKLQLPDEVSEEAMNESIRDNGIWVQSADKKGMELHVRGAGGRLESLLNKNGEVTYIPYTTIQNSAPIEIPSAWDAKKRKTRERMKGLFKR